jgi:hypothetical protein
MDTLSVSGVSYQPPVDQLLKLGEPHRHGTDVDYAQLGIGPAQVPDLIRMATDEVLNSASSKSKLVWAPVHAWWALAHLRAEEAVVPLLSLLRRVDENNDDWVSEDLPRVMAEIGPASVGPLVAYLADVNHGEWARSTAAKALEMVGSAYPELRGECVLRLTAQLAKFAEQSEALNALLISALLDIYAVESAAVMESAFASGRVDDMVCGDWEDVAIELGLQTHRNSPPQPNKFTELGDQLRTALGYTLDADNQLVPLATANAPALSAAKTGRNDPCPCGSGKKFKKCCGR